MVAVFYNFFIIVIAYWWDYLFMKPNVERLSLFQLSRM